MLLKPQFKSQVNLFPCAGDKSPVTAVGWQETSYFVVLPVRASSFPIPWHLHLGWPTRG